MDACLNRPLRQKDQDLYALMLVGAYQLIYMRVPDHAAVHETVAAVSELRKPWAKGLVNAALRQIAASGDRKEPSERSFRLPAWIMERFRRDFPDQADALARSSFERAPMSLRVNLTRTTPDDYRQKLADAGIESDPGHFPEHLILNEPLPVRSLPGYPEGLVSVQDAGAQFAAHVSAQGAAQQAAIRRPLRILDACAAPGGKLFHLAERFPQAECFGVELNSDRLDYMRTEAARLGHENVRLLAGDATGLDWLASSLPAQFDLILLDAPCTGSGTLRRHPDIKMLRGPEDVSAAASLQLDLLNNLWTLIAPGGSLVYCTCSLFSEENDAVIEAFRRELADEQANGQVSAQFSAQFSGQKASVSLPELEAIALPLGTATRFGWQLLPLPAGGERPNRTVDGFYFARMTRREKAR